MSLVQKHTIINPPFASKSSKSTPNTHAINVEERGAVLQKDAPWRAASTAIKPIPKSTIPLFFHSLKTPTPLRTPFLSSRYVKNQKFNFRHPDPIGHGLGTEAIVEAAGPECVVPGQITPVKIVGVKVWPIEIDLKFLEPVGKELKNIGKFMDSAVELMNKSFDDR
ncbi:hypothetical protein E3N88_45050 [Mikania micrantha]|uniref:Uncharacterized protein n=1 Tax=Mikania micrantha TaxID=192012 RepID=A0A5N6LAC7_9ASTR|nr:hypothetical protein E3N88_45050 [Mikania micrantha]